MTPWAPELQLRLSQRKAQLLQRQAFEVYRANVFKSPAAHGLQRKFINLRLSKNTEYHLTQPRKHISTEQV